jgi:spore coat polysaccharide biosynthesis predicted glycosyltransferase SpsG
MKALILTEASRQWGLGHLYRCLAFSQDLIARGYYVQWGLIGDDLCQEFAAIHTPECRFYTNWNRNDFEELFHEVSFVLIDSYHASIEIYEFAFTHCANCLWIDDSNRLRYPPGYILNPNDSIQKGENDTHYHRARILSGFEFQPIRAEFIPSLQRIYPEQIAHILVLMGGTDIYNLTPQALLSAHRIYPQAEIHAIVPRNDQRTQWQQSSELPATFYPSLTANLLRGQMEWADITISAGGQTIFELLRLGTPTIAIEVADNQHQQLTLLQQRDALRSINALPLSSFPGALDQTLLALAPKSARVSLSQQAMTVIDGRGVQRALQHMGVHGS